MYLQRNKRHTPTTWQVMGDKERNYLENKTVKSNSLRLEPMLDKHQAPGTRQLRHPGHRAILAYATQAGHRHRAILSYDHFISTLYLIY
jgi:hypothetical protein